MKQISFAGREVPAIIVGCMRLDGVAADACRRFISSAVDSGLFFFDHADIYGAGESEAAFGNAAMDLKIPREKLFIQTKCGIVPGKMYDFSEKHIVESVEGSLKRLRTDYLDCLLLHRPDVLFEPEEVASAFDKLERAGKVRAFGVSNMTPCQIDLLKTAVKQPVAANQLRFSPVHAGMISCNVEMNMITDHSFARDGYVLEYCRLHDIAVQAWSPFRYGFFEGVFLDDPKYKKLNDVLAEIGEKYGVSKAAVVAAWILRHPAKTQVITGTVNPAHLLDIAAGGEVSLTREEWYSVYIAAGNYLP